MAEINVTINGKDYRLACDDGQEARVKTLAAQFSDRVATCAAEIGKASEGQALVVAALAVLDEFDEAKARWTSTKPEGAAAEWVAAKLEKASDRMEKMLASKS